MVLLLYQASHKLGSALNVQLNVESKWSEGYFPSTVSVIIF